MDQPEWLDHSMSLGSPPPGGRGDASGLISHGDLHRHLSYLLASSNSGVYIGILTVVSFLLGNLANTLTSKRPASLYELDGIMSG